MSSVRAAASQSAAPRAHIATGDVIGVTANGADAFKGIPYAAPPTGDLRWRAPQPPKPWSTPLSAEDYGYSCPQRSAPEHVVPSSRGATTDEDCLTLNVWVPTQRPSQPMPVMVWIHGGGNISGTSAQTYYDGTAFARDGIVLVSFNYRLGALGFFTHPATKVANFGLRDQLAALRWVKQNIAAFGGDPGNVTVFGESAGGTDILILMTSRKAAGYFHKAIVESAGWWNHVPDLAEGQKAGAAIATRLGLPGASATAAQLRSLPVAKLVALSDAEETGPVIDDDLLTESPQVAIEHNRAQPIPLIIGTNDNEGSLISPDTPLTDVAGDLSAADLDALIQLHGVHEDSSKAQWIFRDTHFSMPARWVATRASKSAPVFLYRFEYVASFLARRRTAANHGSEIPFVFATWPDYRLNEADQHMTRALHGCWVAFAQTGRPACPDSPRWPSFSVDSDVWMRFGTDIRPEPVSDRAVLNFLQQALQK